MARVFVALRDGATQICVLKQILEELRSNDIVAARFKREAHASAHLQHANIARVLDASLDRDPYYIAVEFIPGMDLEAMHFRMLEKRLLLPYPVVISAISDVLAGLDHAHRATGPGGEPLHLLHRDLSPRNMMLGFDGIARVIDFGLARGRLDEFKTAPGIILGTLRFCSPEQCLSTPLDHRSDLYSVGVVLYELLTGVLLIEPGTPIEVVKRVVNLRPEPVTRINPDLPAAFDPLLAKALAPQREDRWASGHEFRAALLHAAGRLAEAPTGEMISFLAQAFPTEVAQARSFQEMGAALALGAPLAQVRNSAATLVTRRRSSAPPPAEGSVVVPQPLTQAGDLALATKTAFPLPTAPMARAPHVLLSVKTAETRVQVRQPQRARSLGAESVRTVLAPSQPQGSARVRALWRGRLEGALFGAVVLVIAALARGPAEPAPTPQTAQATAPEQRKPTVPSNPVALPGGVEPTHGLSKPPLTPRSPPSATDVGLQRAPLPTSNGN